MPYSATKIYHMKSYPTFQFHADADSKTLDTQEVFKVCILQTFSWLRERLKDYSDIPDEIKTPEPDDYKDFPDEALMSFSYDNDFRLEVIYIEKEGVWSFLISEPDMGANKDQINEREPVHGRRFNTEIALKKLDDHVEIGVKTICSEPSDTTEDCEVFRPVVVRKLIENKDIKLIHGGFIVDGKPLEIRSNGDVGRFFDIYENEGLNFPVVLVADSATETTIPQIVEKTGVAMPLNLRSGFSVSGDMSLSIDPDVIKFKNGVTKVTEKAKKPKESATAKKAAPIKTKLPALDHEKLARTLAGFAVVVFAEEKYFQGLEKKLGVKVSHGDIIIFRRQNELERYTYSQYKKDIDGFLWTLRSHVSELPKRQSYNYGEVLFNSAAKMRDYHIKRHETDSMEEQFSIYKLENAELKNQIKEFTQQNTDMQQTADALRVAQKKLEQLQRELDSRVAAYDELAEQTKTREDAYAKSAELISFYKEQYDAAATFPTEKDDVCDWIEKNFADNIVVLPKARSEMRKYSSALDVAGLCDGVLYLDAYAQYKKQEISEDRLKLYAERNHWEVQGCGKETLKLKKKDYTVVYNDKQCLLDSHIKYGIKAEVLIRIYFFWDDDTKKVVIGVMPRHLPTVKNTT